MRKFLLVFFLFNLFLSSYYLDVWRNANTTSRALPIITYFESGTFRIDKYHELTLDKAYVNGHYYTDKAPLPTYVVLPFFGLLNISGIIQPDAQGNLFGDHIYILGGLLTASIPFSLLLCFVFIKIRKNNSSVSPVLIATLPFYGSFLFVFTGTYFAHIFAAVLLLGSFIFLRRKDFFIAGILGGLAFLSEYNLAVILLFWGGVILLREKRLKPFVYFSLGILPALLFIIYYNSLFSSSPFTFMYKHHNFSELDANYGFVIPGLQPFWGLSFGTYRGMFFYTPFLLIGLYIIYRYIKNEGFMKLLTSYMFIPFIVYYIFISSYFAWWGGWTYGPRFLLAMILILLFQTVIYYSKQKYPKAIFYTLTGLGFLIIILAKGTIAYSAPTGIINPFMELVIGGIKQGIYNPNNVLSMAFGMNPGFAFLFFIIVFILGIFTLQRWYRKWEIK